MAPDEGFCDFVLDQLRGLDGVTARPMFGGHGLYRHSAFFGIVHGGCLYLRTTDETRPAYVEAGMGPFRPNDRQTLRTYYEVPASVLDDADELAAWARAAAG
jgi:DNA transformation protein